jgi:hypothetical protein
MSQTVTDYLIGPNDLAHVYLSLDPFGCVFDETLDLCKWDFHKHHSGGLQFISKNRRLLLTSMDASSPGAQIDKWRSRICGAWLQSIGGTAVMTLDDVHKEFIRLSQSKASMCTLTFSHPEILPDISQHGLPIISCNDYHSQFTHDQLNNRIDMIERGPPSQRTQKYDIVVSGEVRQYTTRVMRLTHGRLLQQDNWMDWQML